VKFGADFREVRIHSDEAGAAAAQSAGARAVTVGRDIAFNRGFFSPRTPEGRLLLAHELAHVVQQSFRMGTRSASDSEADARQAAASVAGGRAASVRTSADAAVQADAMKKEEIQALIAENEDRTANASSQDELDALYRERDALMAQRNAAEAAPPAVPSAPADQAAAQPVPDANHQVQDDNEGGAPQAQAQDTTASPARQGQAQQAASDAGTAPQPSADTATTQDQSPQVGTPGPQWSDSYQDRLLAGYYDPLKYSSFEAWVNKNGQEVGPWSDEEMGELRQQWDDIRSGKRYPPGEDAFDAGSLKAPPPQLITPDEGGVYLLPQDQAQREHAQFIEGGTVEGDLARKYAATTGGADVQKYELQEMVKGYAHAYRTGTPGTQLMAAWFLSQYKNEHPEQADWVDGLLERPASFTDFVTDSRFEELMEAMRQSQGLPDRLEAAIRVAVPRPLREQFFWEPSSDVSAGAADFASSTGGLVDTLALAGIGAAKSRFFPRPGPGAGELRSLSLENLPEGVPANDVTLPEALRLQEIPTGIPANDVTSPQPFSSQSFADAVPANDVTALDEVLLESGELQVAAGQDFSPNQIVAGPSGAGTGGGSPIGPSPKQGDYLVTTPSRLSPSARS
jgi:hypothetical protein